MRWAFLVGAGVLLFTPMALAQSSGPSGTQVAASPNAIVEADAYVAREFATADRSFDRRGVYTVASGTVVRYVQRTRNVLVRDAGVAILVSRAGNVLAVNDFSAAMIPEPPPSVITPLEAQMRARAIVGGNDPGDDAARSFLVWTREFGFPELVYECDFAPENEVYPDAPRVLIRARDGVVIRRENRAREFTARVYTANPVTTPNLSTVTLTGLADGATTLTGDDVHSFNCIDEGRMYSLGGARAHLCTPEQTAHPDATGLYSFDISDPQQTDDIYGELSMYYHASDYLRFARTLGFSNYRTRPINVYANVRFPWDDSNFGMGNITGSLLPWDNAAFIPGTPPNPLTGIYGGGHDVIMFGQGTTVDFSYDGDVVAHESGHSVVASTADFGLDFQDEWGTNNAPNSLNEGLADYFSSARAGDPNVGEYAGAIEGSGDAIRSLTSDATYPEGLFGEAHNDSLPSSSAMWTIRTQLGAQFDQAAYEALTMEFPAPSHFSLASHVIDATQRILGPDAANMARAEYTSRGIVPDGPRVKLSRPGGNYMLIPGVNNSPLPYVPGYYQFKLDLPPMASRVRFQFLVYSSYAPTVHISMRLGSPISYTYPAPGQLVAAVDAEQMIADNGDGNISGLFDLQPVAQSREMYFSVGMYDGVDTFGGPLKFTIVAPVAPSPDAGSDASTDAHASDASDASHDGARTDAGRDVSSTDLGTGDAGRVEIGGGCSTRGATGKGDFVLAALAMLSCSALRRRRRGSQQ